VRGVCNVPNVRLAAARYILNNMGKHEEENGAHRVSDKS